jgi:quercetin dioxygenase-like cupin family protein
MRKRYTWGLLLGAAMGVALIQTTNIWATPAIGFVSTTISLGRFDHIEVFNHLTPPQGGNQQAGEEQRGNTPWFSMQKTKGTSDLYVQSNVWQPGGSSGWHTHPGHSLITVVEGTITAYEGDDPDCKPRVYEKGMGFVDPGDGHIHNLRNEGTVGARTITVQLLPAGAPRRIDAEQPRHCGF